MKKKGPACNHCGAFYSMQLPDQKDRPGRCPECGAYRSSWRMPPSAVKNHPDYKKAEAELAKPVDIQEMPTIGIKPVITDVDLTMMLIEDCARSCAYLFERCLGSEHGDPEDELPCRDCKKMRRHQALMSLVK